MAFENKIDQSTFKELDLLKMIPSELKIFDNLSVSSGGQESDLSGPFSDYEKSEAYIEKRKSADMRNMDMYTYFSFSPEFRSAMESARREISTSDVCEETRADIDVPRTDSKIQLDLEKRAGILLREIMTEFRKKTVIEDEEKKSNLDSSKGNRKGKPKDEKKKIVEEEEEFYDTMSGYWRMLSAYDDFRISPPYYNAFENETPHWLETKLIPFEVTESARKKCLDWLKENFENY